MKRAPSICILLICVLNAHRGVAADKKELSAALASIEANLKTSAGKRYDADIGKQLSQQYAARIRQCRQSTGSDRLDPFDIFLNLAVDGRVQRALAYPETPLAACTRNALSVARFSAPPHGDYWINIHLELKK